MEGVILEPEFFGNLRVAFTGIIVAGLVCGVGICLAYLEDEDRMGRTLCLFDEPLCGIGETRPEEEAQTPEYRKAA